MAYILISYIPQFMIKLAPLVQNPEVSGGMYYFYNNLFHQWGYKIVVSLIIAAIVSVLINKMRR
jgi:hypothetical protein